MNKSIKVLIVEDELSILTAISGKIQEIGWQSLEAKNGEEGLKLYIAEKPDVILLDIIMPVMDGIAMLKELKKLKSKTPVLIFSNLSDQSKVAEALELGSFNYMIKADNSLDDIVAQIKVMLHK